MASSSSVALKAFLILGIVLFGLLTVNSETAGALVDPASTIVKNAVINGAEGEKTRENRHARKLLLGDWSGFICAVTRTC
ncbi:hypothetical protein Scep_010559 [Stephania cephalantha]|uniref:Uncharacterized protein n=1 Tax=Stephania cephalantha TaxID=152367 RepID=A0AAP0JVA1_9MAGN